MERKLLLIIAAVMLVLLLPGCSGKNNDPPAAVNEGQAQVEPNSPDPVSGQQSENQQNSAQQPHGFSDFQGPGSQFTGGNAVNDYTLTMVRRVSHPEFVRLVFEFTGKIEDKAELPPEYTVTMENEKKITMKFSGVVKEEVMEYKQDILSLSELIENVTFDWADSGEALVTLTFKRPVLYQVFDLAKSARVVLVFRQDTGQFNKM